MPRKKGSKSKLGVPIKGLPEVIALVRMAYDNVGDKSMSFREMTTFMKLPKGISTPAIGAISAYHLIEKSNLGWRVSDLGKNAIFNDVNSVKEAFTKNPIFADLYEKFGDKEVTAGIIENYIKSKYKKGGGVAVIINRFLEGLEYINGLKGGKQFKSIETKQTNIDITNLLKLKYALNPPKKEEISKLAVTVSKDLESIEDISIKTISKSITKNKENSDVLNVLINNVLDILNNISRDSSEKKECDNDDKE